MLRGILLTSYFQASSASGDATAGGLPVWRPQVCADVCGRLPNPRAAGASRESGPVLLKPQQLRDTEHPNTTQLPIGSLINLPGDLHACLIRDEKSSRKASFTLSLRFHTSPLPKVQSLGSLKVQLFEEPRPALVKNAEESHKEIPGDQPEVHAVSAN